MNSIITEIKQNELKEILMNDRNLDKSNLIVIDLDKIDNNDIKPVTEFVFNRCLNYEKTTIK